MKPLLFRFKIAALSLLVSGILVVGFGIFFLVTIGRVGMARIDDEIRALGEAQIRSPQPLSHWSGFDRSLRFIYGDRQPRRFAVRVLDRTGSELFVSEHWPANLNALAVPELLSPPLHEVGGPRPNLPGPEPESVRGEQSLSDHAYGFIRRLDRDGDNRVSADEFDGPRRGFSEFDRDGDGYIIESEAPRHGPGQGRKGENGAGRPPGPGRDSRQRPGPPRLARGRLRSPQAPKVPAFETHRTSSGTWRVAFMGNDSVTLIIAADLAKLRRESVFFRNAFLIVTPVFLLILGFVGWLIASRALRPVAIVTRTAEAITARGLDKRIPAMAADAEIQRLVDVINSMLERLERSFNQAARFSADAAHELQTPLTILQGELDNAVQWATAGSEEQQRYSSLLEEVRGLKSVVQKLLLLARADVGQLPLSLEKVDLSALIRSGIEDVEAMAQGLTVEANVPEGIHANVDADLVGQVVRNMTGNAIRYSRKGGTVLFELKVRDSVAMFTLANTSEPIPDPDRTRIFDRFHRVDRARSRETRGAGLGLSLAREIARAHGGDLVLNRATEDMVSFTLTLPLETPDGVATVD